MGPAEAQPLLCLLLGPYPLPAVICLGELRKRQSRRVSERVVGHVKTPGLPSFPCLLPAAPCAVLAPWASEPEVNGPRKRESFFT